MTFKENNNENKLSRFFLLAGILLIAFNLRPAITSVGPLMGTIRDDLGLDNWNAGLITSLPLLAFALMSPIAPKLGNRFGNERTLLLGLLILFAGISIRSIAFTPTLYIGTTLVGFGIAIGNVLLPGLIKEKYPDRVGLMTSLYSTSMVVFAATATGLSIPLAEGLGLGWQNALLSWAALAFIGLIVWSVAMKTNPPSEEKTFFEPSATKLLKSPLAWQVTAFMGLQSFLFYVTISWLPEMLQATGLSISLAGWLLSYMQFISLPATFIAPILAGRFPNQLSLMWGIGFCAITGLTGILIGGNIVWMTISVTFLGITTGASISLALVLLSMRAKNARQAAELSGMAQSFGYLLAAIGPMLIGLIFDLTGSWNGPLLVLLAISVLIVVSGLGAGRNKYVLE